MPTPRLTGILGVIAKWAGIFGAVGFGCLLASVVIFGPTTRPSIALLIFVLSLITAGVASLAAFTLRGAIERRWRFSLRTLLIVTALAAGALGLTIWAAR